MVPPIYHMYGETDPGCSSRASPQGTLFLEPRYLNLKRRGELPTSANNHPPGQLSTVFMSPLQHQRDAAAFGTKSKTCTYHTMGGVTSASARSDLHCRAVRSSERDTYPALEK